MPVSADQPDKATAVSALTIPQVARLLADEGWEGRWNPRDHLNLLPLAYHTAQVLSDAGHDIVKRPIGPEGGS